MARWDTTVIPTLWRLRQEGWESEIILGYISSSRPAWLHETLYKIKSKRERERDKKTPKFHCILPASRP